jgi:hypothetical protein
VLLGNGDGTFGPKIDSATGFDPVSVAIGDLNGDGRPDVATAGLFSTVASVMLGNGDGTFGPRTDHSTGGNEISESQVGDRAVAIGDLNGDGKPDLAVANGDFRPTGTVGVLLGNGDGTFRESSVYPTGAVPAAVAIGDLDGDGRPDLAVSNGLDATVSVLPGNGDGTFGAKSDYGPAEISVAIGDLNGDGRLDLALAVGFQYGLAGYQLTVLLNIGCSPMPMSFHLTPRTLDLQSQGRWVTAILEPEPPASPADIDIASILLNGGVTVDASAPISIGDADHNHRPGLIVKFDRAALESTLSDGEAVPFTVTGRIANGCFEATDRIRVIHSP